MKYSFRYVAVGLVVALIGITIPSKNIEAQYGYNSQTYGACISLQQNLVYGSSDYRTGGAVSQLQQFLISGGYLGSYSSNGYYDNVTVEAVRNYQRARGINPAGSVGPLTRNAIRNDTCGGAYSFPTQYPTNYYPNQCSYPYTYGNQYQYSSNPYQYGGTYNCGYNYSVKPYINFMTPNSGSPGSYVTIYGTGFSPTGNTVRFGPTTLSNISSPNGTMLYFTVPSQFSGCQYYWMCGGGYQNLIPDTYNVTVMNASGEVSNPVTFTVNNYNYNNPYYPYQNQGSVTVGSINGPTSLQIGNTGVWTLVVNNQNNNGYVTTSVRWGDEGMYITNAETPQTLYNSGQQTQTFTHTYRTQGVYTAVFTVRDAYGNQNSVSSTVNIW
jgi:peptidoglycan hydrolase-like protein with peptidoglycan-binding domain